MPRLRELIDKDYSAENGWLSPEGELFCCMHRCHRSLEDQIKEVLGYDYYTHLDELGWLKLDTTDYGCGHPIVFLADNGNRRYTQKQIDYVYEWYQHNSYPEAYDHFKMLLKIWE
jgi:hypothetical protein